jgi:uncharacterized protein
MPRVFPAGAGNQRPLSPRPDVLTFRGAHLQRPLTVIGRVTARLWATSTAPDADLAARLIDVHPDGYLANVCDGILRARYRLGLARHAWLQPGVAHKLAVDLWSAAHTFEPGHRVVLQVTSRSFPRWSRNWNTMGDPGTTTSGQVAEQTVWCDAEHASRIVLPIVGS